MKQKLVIVLGSIVALLLVAAYLRIGPRPWEVQITGVTGDGRQVQYRIETLRGNTTKTLIFRNEDAGLLPPYFKFDSADLQSTASRIARNCPDTPVKVWGYSMRIPWLDMFPNALSIKAPEKCLQAPAPARQNDDNGS
ncbi:MAG: DUF1523 family protein [Chromatiaceae bacterium]|nr:MAG: DUF1523 family protein [Chromatiaceae bacterium]